MGRLLLDLCSQPVKLGEAVAQRGKDVSNQHIENVEERDGAYKVIRLEM